ncbi:hypothetical protein F5Y14DRAFT_456057 [Nemania sp. NC0429]|nr:hypothetical protein F5Y14DRAFT_456057 [Nemania sp. NC0429]
MSEKPKQKKREPRHRHSASSSHTSENIRGQEVLAQNVAAGGSFILPRQERVTLPSIRTHLPEQFQPGPPPILPEQLVHGDPRVTREVLDHPDYDPFEEWRRKKYVYKPIPGQ